MGAKVSNFTHLFAVLLGTSPERLVGVSTDYLLLASGQMPQPSRYFHRYHSPKFLIWGMVIVSRELLRYPNFFVGDPPKPCEPAVT